MHFISPRQLEVFVAVATTGSVRVAADRLFLSQPAASMALAELERQIGLPLFARERGRLRLNDRGRELLPLARELLERHAEFGRRAQGTITELAGEIGIGASNTVGNYLVGDLLGGFAAAHPGVSLRLGVANTARIAQGVLDHEFDIGCVEGPVAHPSLEVRPWREDRLVVCARPEHALARKKRLRREDFAGERWVLRERGSATRALSERALAELPEGSTVLELDQSEAIKQAVIAGLGIACLPEVAVGDAVRAGRIAMLPTPFLDLRRTLSVLLHRQRYRGAVLEAFLATL
ncbi:DNA-binding transcriptional LysR family regulator [Luteibacter jiangsuensis]|uniref:DNA-binding transcriptional LysR family regulator n=1 Tax=Luteibacter jiangsuensis TaxID=637577 RepID=A0ABT9T2G2_9GAMM|nr:LysR family transcriptional regulator [Luteibacter jiangsuensis]MDQ0011447.1 DNA-binding transcriptional LysR family regulator [Luteibacter jiangsuensis]